MKRTTIMMLLANLCLLLQSCGPSAEVIKMTAQAEVYQTATQQAGQAALQATQTAMASERQALEMTQTAMAVPVATAIPAAIETVAPPASAPTTSVTDCPVYVYQDWGVPANQFVPEGWMGDTSDISIDENFMRDTNRPNVLKITYTPRGGMGWAGIYWWVPGTSWGNGDKIGLNLSCASKLTFWVRGEKGGEKAEFKVGGIRGNYVDSLQPAKSTGPIVLTNKWFQYSIDLKGKDLSYIAGGFVWVTNKSSNPGGAVIYLDDIRFEK